MFVRGRDLVESGKGRRVYPLTSREIAVQHFVTRVTQPDNPFGPHKHEQQELWFILDGQAIVALDGLEHVVEGEDLIEIAPWVEHGLRTETEVKWICMG
jgi:mannose-6-phosphate isomerase-like protein (cupin superfamily)